MNGTNYNQMIDEIFDFINTENFPTLLMEDADPVQLNAIYNGEYTDEKTKSLILDKGNKEIICLLYNVILDFNSAQAALTKFSQVMDAYVENVDDHLNKMCNSLLMNMECNPDQIIYDVVISILRNETMH